MSWPPRFLPTTPPQDVEPSSQRTSRRFPTDLVLIESISAILQLVTAGRGLTLQPRQALIPPFPGYKVLTLEGVTIPVLWEAVTRPEPGDNVSTLINSMKADAFQPEGVEHDA